MPVPAAAIALALLLGAVAMGSKKATPPLDPGMPPDLDARVKNALATVTDPNVLDQLAMSLSASGYTNAAQACRLRAAQLRGQVSVPGVPTTPPGGGTPPIIPPGDMPPPIEPPRPPPVYIPPGGNIPGTNWPIPPTGTPPIVPPGAPWPPGYDPTRPPPSDIPPLPPITPGGTIPPLPPMPPVTVPIEDLDKNIPAALAAAVAALLAKPNWTDADLQTADALAITLDQQGFPIAAAKIKSKALAVRALRAGAGVLVDIGKILTTPGGKLPPLPPTIPTTPPIVTTPPSVPPILTPPGVPPPKPTGPMAKTYKVLAGDNPSSIALKFTGNGANFRELAAANPDKSARILAGTIYAGEIMTLPDKWPASPIMGTPPPATVPPMPPLAGTHMTIRQGSSGPDVRLWQTIVGVPADGQFGPQTHGATVTWQRTRGLVADGIVGPATWAKAQGGAAPPPVVSIPIPIPGMPSIPIPVAVPPFIPVSVPPATTAPGLVVIKEGSRGADVVMWQKIIGVPADGIFGPGTAAATRAWQASRGLTPDGIVGPATWTKALSQVTASAPAVITAPPPLFPVPASPIPAAVPAPPPIIPISAVVAPPPAAPPPATMPPPTAPTPTPVVTRATIKEGSTGPDVVTWQKIVGVAADGKFGPGTKNATIAWQKQKGLVADGIVGPKSWAAAIPMSAAAGYGGRGPRYKVKRGDTPFSIAKQYTGDPMRMFELAHANPHASRAIENGILFQGQVLFLPPTWNIARPSTQAAAALSGVLEIIGGHHAAGQSGHYWGA